MNTQISENYDPTAPLFQNIPRKKLDEALEEIYQTFSKDGLLTREGVLLSEAVEQYWYSNIPVDYWFRDMFEFRGEKSLLKRYTEITQDLKLSYKNGTKVCFAGKHGSGKTMTVACILKRVIEHRQYTALYVNLTDIINTMLSPAVDKDEARRKLLETDFLVIDEVDQRFMGTDNAADLFGRILEPVMRTRIQNRMPLLFCTNSPNVTDSFSGPLKASFTSLMHLVQLHAILPGKDFRVLEVSK